MKIILLSGGSGKRLWPLSNTMRSKQFLKVLYNQSEKKYESMVQRVWRQLNSCHLAKNTVITTNILQKEMITLQLGDIPVIEEPSRKDTFPAIALTCLFFKDELGVSIDEDIIVSPVDPYVEDPYFEKFNCMKECLNETNASLVLMGIKPTSPSGKYGYLLPERTVNSSYIEVNKFKEKPTVKEAEKLIEMGALWNSGVFCFKLNTILKIIKEKNLPDTYKDFLKKYNEIEAVSFDFAVVESISNIKAIEYNGVWKDLGTWDSLISEVGYKSIGNVKTDDLNLKNNFVINELDIPIITLGLENYIVAASPDGILISDINKSDNLKSCLNNLHDAPMYVERIWGRYKVLDYKKYGHIEVTTKRVQLDKGEKISYQYHRQRKEVWTILSGEGEVVIDNVHHIVSSGSVVEINPLTRHSIHAISDLEFIEVQRGIIEDRDVYRIKQDGE